MTTEYKIQDKTYSIPSSWSGVKWSQYLDLINLKDAKPFEYLSIKTGVPVEILEMLDLDSIAEFTLLTSFFEDDSLQALNFYPKELEINIAHLPVKHILKAQQAIKKYSEELGYDEPDYKVTEKDLNHIYLNAAADFVKIYTGDDIGDKMVADVFGVVCFFLLKFKTFFTSDMQGFTSLKQPIRKLTQA